MITEPCCRRKVFFLAGYTAMRGERGIYNSCKAVLMDLSQIREEIGECKACELAKGRTNIVFGEGNAQAGLMLIGEGPGADEDASGRPFVGAAGQLLDRILASVGITREEVYIANVVKCRPPDNRVPSRAEAAACLPWLFKQIEAVRPAVIVLLGATALNYLVGAQYRISSARGQWLTSQSGINILPTYHPAALLRDPRKKVSVWEDFQEVFKRYDALYLKKRNVP